MCGGERGTKPPGYLASFALDEEINSLVLVAQLMIQFILEGMKSFCFMMATRYRFGLTLSLSGAELY